LPILGGLLLAVLAGRASGQARTVDPPSLQTLKALRFSKLRKIDQIQPVSYSDMLEVISSAKGYAKGLTLLPEYHDRQVRLREGWVLSWLLWYIYQSSVDENLVDWMQVYIPASIRVFI
jgi:hypothetical protein